MSYIFFSQLPGKIPTVSQLETADSRMGYNQHDGLFYALKVVGITKSVICIGGGGVVINPGGESTLNQLNSGSVVWLHDLVFHVTACNYFIQGLIYNSAAVDITLDAASTENPRIDLIYVNKYGQAGVLKGIAEETPAKPVCDPLTQLELTQILIPANATIPLGISEEAVYEENIEWASSIVHSVTDVTVNFSDTNSPNSGTKQTRITKTASRIGAETIAFTKAGPQYYALGSTLILSIRISTAFLTSTSIVLTLKSDTLQVGSPVIIKDGTHGFDRNVLTYQTLAIPFSSFNAASSQINVVQISFAGTDVTGTLNIDFDDIKFQNGITPGITVETDPVFQAWLATNPLSNGGSIDIPKLQLDSGRYHSDGGDYAIVDTLRCWWQSNARKWLDYNPEIWLFRYKRNFRTKEINESTKVRKKNKKWAHPPHLNGVKFPNSNFFTGKAGPVPPSLNGAGYHTEWELTNTIPLDKKVIPINLFEFVYGVDDSSNFIALTDSTFFNLDPSKIRFSTKSKSHSKSLAFRFAIVIDNPNEENCSKLIGQLSDPIYLISTTIPYMGGAKNILNWSKTQKSYGWDPKIY
jgi:hypothetical protein